MSSVLVERWLATAYVVASRCCCETYRSKYSGPYTQCLDMFSYQRKTREEEHREYCHNASIPKGLDSRDSSSLYLVFASDDAILGGFVAAIMGLENSEALIDSYNPECLQRRRCQYLHLLCFRHFCFQVRVPGRVSVRSCSSSRSHRSPI
jgi:hypothetical protein